MLSNRLALALALVLLATAVPVAQAPTGIRDVTADPRSLVNLNTKVRFTTMVILPVGEEVVEIVCGDKDFWVISATANVVHVKPAKEKSTTNLNIVGSSGTIYSFMLTEGAWTMPDLKVYVTAAEGSQRANGKPLYYPAAKVEALEEELRQAHATMATGLKIADQTVADARTKLPLEMKFAYRTLPYEKPFFIRSMWHDSNFTYVKTDARELPALYELKDGEAALVNFTNPAPDTYVVPKVLDRGYFSIGKQKLEFEVR